MKPTHTSSLSVNFFVLMLMVLGSQSCSPTRFRDKSIREWEKSEWKVVKTDKKENPAWVIYKRKIAGTNFLEYKIEGTITSAPKACLDAFKQDIHQQADESMRKKFPTYEISEETEEGLLTYVIHNEPFPLKDTEMRVRYLFSNEEGGSTGVQWKEAWEDYPVEASRKLSRVESFRGYWKFTSAPNNSSIASNGVQFDPQKMPKWLFEPMVLKFLTKGLVEIRANANIPGHQLPVLSSPIGGTEQ